MSSIIHFRSRYGHLERAGISQREVRSRSPESSNIRTGDPYDDVRDIVWGRSTGTDVYVKDRYTPTGIHISIFDDGFSDRKKSFYKEALIKSIDGSAKWAQYPYLMEKYKVEDPIPKREDKLIFVLTPSIELSSYKHWLELTGRNDLIFLTILHPYERDPSDIFFESKQIQKSYQEAFIFRCKEIEKLVRKYSGSVIFLDIDEDPVIKLNHFFKHRYG